MARGHALLACLALALTGCSDGVAPAPTPEPARSTAPPEPTDEPAAPEAEAEPVEVAEVELPAPEPLETPPAPSDGAYDGTVAGLPEVGTGRVRLDVVGTSTERVDGRRVPRVAITNPDARASLDPLLTDFARGNRCQVKLATETFVSVECAYEDEIDIVSGMRSVLVRHFQVGEDGRFAPVSTASLLHPREGRPGGDRELLQWLSRGTEPSDSDVVFIRTGLQIIPRSEDDDRQIVSWHAVAPFLRADSALGRQLVAKEVQLAPVGTPMPDMPDETWMVRFVEPHEAPHALMALSPELQADARLVEPPGLILTPGHDRSELPELDFAEWESARWIGPFATFGMRQVKEQDSLRDRPGPAREEEDVPVEAGERLYTVDGILGDRRSSANRGWCYAYSCDDSQGRMVCLGGWIPARNLEVIAAPVEDAEPE